MAFAEGHLADAGRQGQRPVDHPNHLGEADGLRRLGQDIAAQLATAADDQAAAGEFQQYGLKEFARRVGPYRDLGGGALGGRFARQLDERAQRVTGLLR